VIERGSTTHDPEQDEQLAHEAQGIVQGQGGSGHVEEARQAEPLPDDTDSPEVQRASGLVGDLAPSTTDSAAGPSVVGGDDADTLTETAAGLSADPVAYSTETPEDARVEGAPADGADPSAFGQPLTDVAETTAADPAGPAPAGAAPAGGVDS